MTRKSLRSHRRAPVYALPAAAAKKRYYHGDNLLIRKPLETERSISRSAPSASTGGETAAHIRFPGQGPVDEPTQERWAAVDYDYEEGDLVGQEGIERTWGTDLRGVDGERVLRSTVWGQPINYFEQVEAIPGNDLY